MLCQNGEISSNRFAGIAYQCPLVGRVSNSDPLDCEQYVGPTFEFVLGDQVPIPKKRQRVLGEFSLMRPLSCC